MEKVQSPNYPGKPLESGDSFRLLELQPGPKTDPVTVRLVDCTLRNHPAYEALSYAWGDPTLTTNIQILYATSDLGAHVPASVTVNCQAALKSLRQPDKARLLWVDAICINQGLVKERNHQLELMTKIYKNASRVAIYLGESADGSNAVMNWIGDQDAAPDYGLPDAQRPAAPSKESIRALLGRAWFHRVWVLQEITFGNDPIVVCGDWSLEWAAFRGVRFAIADGGSFVKVPYSFQYPMEAPIFDSAWDFAPYAQRLLDTLCASRHCGATDPRDKLYAILPLVDAMHEKMLLALDQDTENSEDELPEGLEPELLKKRLAIQPDYNLSAAQVFTQIAKGLIESLGAKHVLRSVQTPRLTPGLPSWVPDWSVTAHGATKRPRSLKYPYLHENTVSRDEGTSLSNIWQLSDYTAPEGGLSSQLHLRALPMGSVSRLGDVCDLQKNLFPVFEWWDLAMDPENPEELWPEDKESTKSGTGRPWSSYRIYKESKQIRKFWDTLGLERGWERRVVPLVLSMVDRYVRHIEVEQHIPPRYAAKSDQQTVSLNQVLEAWPQDSITIRAKMIFEACDRQRFFVTNSGRMGMIPAGLDVKVGDSIYFVEQWDTLFVARSCNVPVQVYSSDKVNNASMALPAQSGEVGRIFTLQGQAYIPKPWEQEECTTVGRHGEAEEIVIR